MRRGHRCKRCSIHIAQYVSVRVSRERAAAGLSPHLGEVPRAPGRAGLVLAPRTVSHIACHMSRLQFCTYLSTVQAEGKLYIYKKKCHSKHVLVKLSSVPPHLVQNPLIKYKVRLV